MISISMAVSVLLYLVIAGLVWWLLWWLVGYLALPQPFDKVARAILAILAVFVLIGLLLWMTGVQVFRP